MARPPTVGRVARPPAVGRVAAPRAMALAMARAVTFAVTHATAAAVMAAALVVPAPSHAADAQPTAADPALEVRVNRLSAELRCLVCQNQSLADSHAPLALDLKNQVREQLQAGRSEPQVIAFMTERYGDFVLYRPPLKATTLLLWGGPLALLLLGGAALLRRIRRQAATPDAPALSAESSEQAARLLGADAASPTSSRS
jgi:cytochrome c-type biogenesis protein CcmH/NrfF